MVFGTSRSVTVKLHGLSRNKNSGASNKKSCENHDDLMNKVSCTLVINAGLASPKFMRNS